MTSAEPAASVRPTRASSAVTVPAIADRQPRVMPIASTIVSASTHSTKDATNVDNNSAPSAALTQPA